jgi:hypothetical protein
MLEYDEEEEMQEYFWDKPKPCKDKYGGCDDDDVDPVPIDSSQFIFFVIGVLVSYVYFKLKNE